MIGQQFLCNRDRVCDCNKARNDRLLTRRQYEDLSQEELCRHRHAHISQ